MWSVVSLRSMGLNQPFTGQASSSLTRPFITPSLSSFQPIFTTVDALDLELLTRLDAIPLPDFRRENDLAFRRNRRLHSE
jgi:hypothetical protein